MPKVVGQRYKVWKDAQMAWRKEEDASPEDLRLEGSEIVDVPSGDRVRILKNCERKLSDGSAECVYLRSARLLFGLAIERGAMENGATPTNLSECRLGVACRECNGRANWSKGFLPWWTAPWLSKSLENARRAGISIIWQLEIRPQGPASKTAFGSWPDSIIRGAVEAFQHALSGKNTGDT